VTALNTEMILLLLAGLIVGGFVGAIMRAKSSGSKLANAELTSGLAREDCQAFTSAWQNMGDFITAPTVG
jgi:hypothetical protein